MEKEIKERFKQIDMRLDELGKTIEEAYERGRKEAIKEVLPKLKLVRKILNEYKSQFPFIQIGRDNVLNDIDNEVDLDKLITNYSSEIKLKTSLNKPQKNSEDRDK